MANEIEFSFLEPSDLMKKTTYDTNTDNVVDVAKDIEGFDSASDDTFYGKVGGVTGFFSVPAGASSINDLTDVDTSGITSGQVLQYNGTTFVAATITGGGAESISDLTDVDTTGVATNNVLKYDGSGWVDGSVAYSEVTGTPTLSSVATSGSYTDLSDKPTIPSSVNDLTDVDTSGITSGQVLQYNGTSFVAATVSSGATSIDDLTDVNLTGISTGQILNWDGSQFVPVNMPDGGGTTPTQLGELTNVDTTGQATNDVLKFNGTNWVPDNVAYSEITGTPTLSTVATTGSYNDLSDQPSIPSAINQLTDVDTTGVAVNNVLKYDGSNWVDGSVAYSEVSGTPTLSTVATTGSYNDLTNLPVLSAVATSGSYTDLSNTPSIPSAINDLSDVDTSGITSGQVLQFNGTSFVAATITGGGASSLDDLSDVDTSTTAPTTGDTLVYNGTEWVPQAPSAGGSTATHEWVEFVYSSGGNFQSANGGGIVSSSPGVNPVVVDEGLCIVDFTFNGKPYPPSGVLAYAQAYGSDTFLMTNITSWSTAKVTAGVSGGFSEANPAFFSGSFNEAIQFTLPQTETGATDGGNFGVNPRLYIMFMFGA